jgi:hypothetical protein
MFRRFEAITCVLIASFALSGVGVRADEIGSLATPADLDRALAETLDRDTAARQTITGLLQREEVRSMAAGYGLDLRGAEVAASTLDGEELQRLSVLAAQADARIAGGDPVLRISLVAALLIVIIIILVAN